VRVSLGDDAERVPVPEAVPVSFDGSEEAQRRGERVAAVDDDSLPPRTEKRSKIAPPTLDLHISYGHVHRHARREVER
jgi:hypothetical protein